MGREDKKVGIIFHSGEIDRILHGISISMVYLSFGNNVDLFFTYDALRYLKGDIKEREFEERLKEVKKLKGNVIACVNSMALLNITRDELNQLVDKSGGLASFLSDKDIVIFI